MAHALTGGVMMMQLLYDWKFDWRYMVRGLTIDKHRGNVSLRNIVRSLAACLRVMQPSARCVEGHGQGC